MAEEEEPAEEGTEEPKPKSKKMLFIIIAVVVVLLVAGGAAFFLLSGGEEEAAGVEGEVETETAKNKDPVYFDIKPPFVANYIWKGQQHYAQISVSVMTYNPDVVSALEKHMPLVKNNLVMVLAAQDFSGLRTSEGKDALRQKVLEEMQAVVNEELGEPGVEKVLFTNFVLQ